MKRDTAANTNNTNLAWGAEKKYYPANPIKVDGVGVNNLPKGWKYWLKEAGFDPLDKYEKACPVNWTGFGRPWRINDCGQLQAGETKKSFDRWANSTFFSTQGIPQTKEEFLQRITYMRQRIERKEHLVKLLCNKDV